MIQEQGAFVDLFAGCGGLSLGLEQAGFWPLFVNELSPDAMATYLVNRKDEYPHLAEKYNAGDIKVVNKKSVLQGLKSDFRSKFRVKDIDLVVGGPPCQGYSGIGHRRSYSVDKKEMPSNHLYQDFADVVAELQPKIFLFENVRGLMNAKWSANGMSGEIWEDVQDTLRSIPNYEVQSELVFAKDYGVPQNRPRVLAVGIRKDIGVKPEEGKVAGGFLPEPTMDYPNISQLFADLVDPEYGPGLQTDHYPSPAANEIQRRMRRDPATGRVRRKGARLSEQLYSKHSQDIINKFDLMIKGEKLPPEMRTKKFAQRVLPREWSEKGPTITATSLPDDYVHYEQARSLTVREWARLQLFPDWYQFEGKRTTGGVRRAGNPRKGIHFREVPKYTQIGNAVPVKLAEEIGNHFKNILS